MKVRISYTVEVSDYMRRAIRLHYGLEGLATRAEIRAWYEAHGSSMEDVACWDLQRHEAGERD